MSEEIGKFSLKFAGNTYTSMKTMVTLLFVKK